MPVVLVEIVQADDAAAEIGRMKIQASAAHSSQSDTVMRRPSTRIAKKRLFIPPKSLSFSSLQTLQDQSLTFSPYFVVPRLEQVAQTVIQVALSEGKITHAGVEP